MIAEKIIEYLVLGVVGLLLSVFVGQLSSRISKLVDELQKLNTSVIQVLKDVENHSLSIKDLWHYKDTHETTINNLKLEFKELETTCALRHKD